jgi:ABC-type glycerol-3-phosphate transport system permease component
MRRRSRRARRVLRVLTRAAQYCAMALITIFAVFPFYWMFLTALKENRDLYVGATDLHHIP